MKQAAFCLSGQGGRRIKARSASNMIMEMGNVIILQSGEKPKIVPRYDTFHDPVYLQFMKAGEKQNRLR